MGLTTYLEVSGLGPTAFRRVRRQQATSLCMIDGGCRELDEFEFIRLMVDFTLGSIHTTSPLTTTRPEKKAASRCSFSDKYQVAANLVEANVVVLRLTV